MVEPPTEPHPHSHPTSHVDAATAADDPVPAAPDADAATDEELPPGTVVGGCRVEEKVGQGGMGAVYRATQIALEKTVALKILPPRLAASAAFVERFLREARLAARLEHPNIVQVYDTGTDAGRSFIVMQYVAGETLRDRIRRAGMLPITVALDYLRQAAQGLAVAHKKKVVHRDVKPENLIVSGDGQLRVADFGLAQEETLTDEGDAVQDRVLASASYMSPEHADLQPVDARSDLYSLGLTFWTLLAGRLPFTADSHLEWVLRHHLDTALPVCWVRRDVPLTLAAILYRLMRKRAEQRYASAEELLEDLMRISKKQIPQVELPWAEGPMRTQRLDATSIVKGGLRRCLDIQRAMKERGDGLLPLGRIMLTNEFVRVVESEYTYDPLEVPFCWPLGTKLPNLAEHPTGHPDERTLRQVAAAAQAEPFHETQPVEAAWRLTRAPVALAAAGHVLVARPLAKLDDPLVVQHMYDALLTYPFPAGAGAGAGNGTPERVPELWLDMSRDAALDIEDVSWIVECQALMKRRGGRLRVRSFDEASAAFLRGHRLDQYLPVVAVAASGAATATATSPAAAAAATATTTATSGGHEPAATTGQTEALAAPAGAPVSPLDEARALLANQDPLAAKAVLRPLLHGGTRDEAKAVAQEVAAACLAQAAAAGRREDYEGALQWLDQALDLVPQHAEALFRKALLLKKLNRPESALLAIDEAIRLRGSDPDWYYNRAIIRARADKLRDAIEDLTRAITLNARHANAYYNRGIAFERLGDIVRARNDFQLALKLNPRFAKVLVPRLKKLEQRISRAGEGVVSNAADAAPAASGSDSDAEFAERQPREEESND